MEQQAAAAAAEDPDSNTQRLPCDVIREIMTHCCSSLDALASFRASCKLLNKLTHDPEFVANLPILSGFIVAGHDNEKYITTIVQKTGGSDLISLQPNIPIDFLRCNVQIKASSDTTGLVFCESVPGIRKFYFLCKPTTKERLHIPDTDLRRSFDTYGLIVMTRSPLHFKILRFSDFRCQCQLFDSKTTPSRWRTLDSTPSLRRTELIRPPSVTVNGYMHFLSTYDLVYAFDPLSEKWDTFPSPLCGLFNLEQKCLMKYKGKLSLISYKDKERRGFWVMNDYSNKLWTHVTIKSVCASSDVVVDSDAESYTASWNKVLNSKHTGLGCKLIFDFQSDFKKMDLAKVTEGGEASNHNGAYQNKRARLVASSRACNFVFPVRCWENSIASYEGIVQLSHRETFIGDALFLADQLARFLYLHLS